MTTNKTFDILIGREYGRKVRQVKVRVRVLKRQFSWPATDQKIRGSNPRRRAMRILCVRSEINIS